MRTSHPFRLAALTAAALALTTASAEAASAVYIKAGNVFIADANGANEHQVTTDGNPSNPDKTAYRSPSEADDGTIVVAKGAELWHLNQNGTVISHAIPATKAYPLAAQVSPDGTHVAYNYSQLTQCVTWDAYSCGFYPSPGAAMQSLGSGASTGLGSVDFLQDPQWVGNSGVLLQTNSGWIDYYDVASDTTVRWTAPEPLGTYTEQPTLSRSGALLAIVNRTLHSGGNPDGDDKLQIWKTNGPPAKQTNDPTLLCAFNAPNASGFSNPRFSLDDAQITWDDASGVQHEAVDAECSGGQDFDLDLDPVLVAGGSQLSFGVHANAPAPLPTVTAGGGAAAGGAPAAGAGGGGAAAAAPSPISLSPLAAVTGSKLGKKGVKVTILCDAACSFTATLQAPHGVAKKLGLKGKGAVALGSVKGKSSPGGTEVTVKLSKKAKTALHHLHKGKSIELTLALVTRKDGGNHKTATTALTVKG